MKVAIPVKDDNGLESKLADYFSQCKYFLITNVDKGKAGIIKFVPNEVPASLQGVRGAEAFMLAGLGVETAIVGRIAEKDRLSLIGNNIHVFIGATGTAEAAIKDQAAGKLDERSDCKKDPDACDCC